MRPHDLAPKLFSQFVDYSSPSSLTWAFLLFHGPPRNIFSLGFFLWQGVFWPRFLHVLLSKSKIKTNTKTNSQNKQTKAQQNQVNWFALNTHASPVGEGFPACELLALWDHSCVFCISMTPEPVEQHLPIISNLIRALRLCPSAKLRCFLFCVLAILFRTCFRFVHLAPSACLVFLPVSYWKIPTMNHHSTLKKAPPLENMLTTTLG